MKTGINPCVDYAFKRVFGSVEYTIILPSFLQAVLGTMEDLLMELQLLNPFSVRLSNGQARHTRHQSVRCERPTP